MNMPCEHCDKADKRDEYYKCDKPCNRAKQCYKNNVALMKTLAGESIDIMLKRQ